MLRTEIKNLVQKEHPTGKIVIVRMRDVLASQYTVCVALCAWQSLAEQGPMLSIYNFLLISDTK